MYNLIRMFSINYNIETIIETRRHCKEASGVPYGNRYSRAVELISPAL